MALSTHDVRTRWTRTPTTLRVLLALMFTLSLLEASRGWHGFRVANLVAFVPHLALRGEVWRFFTGVFVNGDALSLFFSCLLLFQIGSDLVSRWTTRKFLAVFLVLAVLGNTALLVCVRVTGVGYDTGFVGSYPVVGGLIVAWATLFPERPLLDWGVLAVRGRLVTLLALVWAVLYLFFSGLHYVSVITTELGMLVYASYESRSKLVSPFGSAHGNVHSLSSKRRFRFALGKRRSVILVLLVAVLLSLWFFGRPALSNWLRLGWPWQKRPDSKSEVSLVAIAETLHAVRHKYFDPSRVNPQQMLLAALDELALEVPEVSITHDDKAPTLKLHVGKEERAIRVDNIFGPWDVAARLREAFAFLQGHSEHYGLDLRDAEYAACNGMLRSLDSQSSLLKPKTYEEMRLSTTGHFGSAGFVISIRDQRLTVMHAVRSSPSDRAGLRRFDRIAEIDGIPTLNMALDDAVESLRGKPGSKLTLGIERDGLDGWVGVRPFELVREEIQARSVARHELAPGIGYIRLRTFQESTPDELDDALLDLRKKAPIRGLVLDLRASPGGLLSVASEVADRFVEDGVIVTIMSHSEGREDKHAVRAGTQPNYPMVVLIDHQTAAASEIVAGALQILGRAIVIGKRSFGNGNVRLVIPRITPDNAALNLVTGQFLLAGNAPVEDIGITPDVELVGVTVQPGAVRYSPARQLSDRSSKSPHAKRGQTATVTVRYDLPPAEALAALEHDDQDEAPFVDFPVRFARDLVARLGEGTRVRQLELARTFLATTQQDELGKIGAELAKLGVDWSSAANGSKGPRTTDFVTTASTDRANDTVTAGDSMTLSVSVTNRSTLPVHRLRATTKSSSDDYNDKDLLFGRVEPGRTVTARVALGACGFEGHDPGSTAPPPKDASWICKLPKDGATRQDLVRIHFVADNGEAPADAEIRPTLTALPRPRFAYGYQLSDDRKGNGDGQLTNGERATLYLVVKNIGDGRSHNTQVNLRRLGSSALALRAARIDLSGMNPGEQRDVALTFDVLDGVGNQPLELELTIVDRDLREIVTEEISVPLAARTFTIDASRDVLEAKRDAKVRSQPVSTAPIVGELKKGSVIAELGKSEGFAKVRLGGTRFGFVEEDLLANTDGRLERPLFESRVAKLPPSLKVTPETLSTHASSIRVVGAATASGSVRDVYVLSGARKVWYRSNEDESGAGNLTFSFDAPLEPEMNWFVAVARGADGTQTRRQFVVRRDDGGRPVAP
jgi:carboxyl-terminal processing protease